MNKTQLIEHLRKQNFSDKIIQAFEKVKREDFISNEDKDLAYEDIPVFLGVNSATTSQPYTIAFMLDLLELKKGQKILEIGSGSGYVLALMSEITRGEVYGVEIMKELVERSKKVLREYKNIKVIHKNGKNGLLKFASFDRILISASCPNIDTVKSLTKQLKNNGIIVASVKDAVYKVVREGENIKYEKYPGFVFVPLVVK